MAETLDITSIHDFSAQPRGVEPRTSKGLGLSDGVNYEVLMLSSTGGVDLCPETLTAQGLWSGLFTTSPEVELMETSEF